MKQTNEKVYRCDHCNKAMVGVGFMKLHERMCKKNPNNQHKCFLYCKHLSKDTETRVYGGGDEYGEGDEVTCGSSFQCDLNPDVELFSYKLERFKANESRCKGMTRMPLKCDLYETMDGHDYTDHPEYFDL